jgi:hypothetical protein
VSKADREAFLKVLEHAHANACALDASAPAMQAKPTASGRRARAAGR